MNRAYFNKVVNIPIKKIRPSSLQARKYYNEESLDDLGNSISEMGMIYPVVVKPLSGGEYELIIGSRRLKAADKLKLATVPAFIASDVDVKGHLALMLTENLHRDDMTPFEEAWAILKLINDCKMSAQSVARRIGRNEDFVRRRIQLLSLPDEAQKLIGQKKLNMTHVKTLANLKSPEDQVKFAYIASKNNLSSNELTILVQEEMGAQKAAQLRVHTDVTCKKISLKIKDFARWLNTAIPAGIKTDGRRGSYEVQKALKELSEDIARHVKTLRKGA